MPPIAHGPSSFDVTDVFQARRRIAGHVRRTPLVRSAWLSEVSGVEVWLKLESLQITSAFKVRGAVNFVRRLLESDGGSSAMPDTAKIVTASAGNHGQAVAYAGSLAGIRTTIFTPRDAAVTKLEAIRRYGADLRATADSYEHSEELAKAFARTEGATYLSPYSHPDVMAGTGTIALEILEDLPDVAEVVVPLGGGGIVAGMAVTLRTVAPMVVVTAVEAAASPVFTTSLREGRLARIQVKPTLADGLAGNVDPETLTYDLIRSHVRRIALVSEDDLTNAIAGLVAQEHLVVEGAGAAGVASLIGSRLDSLGPRVVVVVTGGNIDASRLLGVLAQAAESTSAR